METEFSQTQKWLQPSEYSRYLVRFWCGSGWGSFYSQPHGWFWPKGWRRVNLAWKAACNVQGMLDLQLKEAKSAVQEGSGRVWSCLFERAAFSWRHLSGLGIRWPGWWHLLSHHVAPVLWGQMADDASEADNTHIFERVWLHTHCQVSPASLSRARGERAAKAFITQSDL